MGSPNLRLEMPAATIFQTPRWQEAHFVDMQSASPWGCSHLSQPGGQPPGASRAALGRNLPCYHLSLCASLRAFMLTLSSPGAQTQTSSYLSQQGQEYPASQSAFHLPVHPGTILPLETLLEKWWQWCSTLLTQHILWVLSIAKTLGSGY